jgi:dihydrofolate reductase
LSKIVVVNSVTLDGVTQAPGRPDEDRRGGFEHGGWALPYNDPVMAEAMGKGMATDGALLFGRRTYEDFAGFWSLQTGNPFTDVLDQRQKFVVSATLREPLAWRNSTLVSGEPADAVARLKERSDQDFTVLGSGELVRSLMRNDLIDEYLLLIHPLVLGAGQRLFADVGPSRPLRLVDSVTTTTGVILATYQPVISR